VFSWLILLSRIFVLEESDHESFRKLRIMSRNILVTGPPRCGKSTLIERVVGRIHKPMTGFFTREMRQKGKRVGFSITTLDGKEGVLAHQDTKSRFRVGKYGVNLEHIDQIAVPSMLPTKADEILVIDEIGKMECFSSLFRQTLLNVLDSDNSVIGSIALKGDEFIQKIRERADVLLIHMTENNRDELLDFPSFYEL
jgi:nucleoside-triphosphatase THEP1